MNAIEFDTVSVTLSGHTVLDAISCEIKEKTLSVIFGPNGAGKSTFLKTILGELLPQIGRVRIFGKGPSQIVGQIGYVPQFFSAKDGFPLTVYDAVLMGLTGKRGIFHRFSLTDRQATLSILETVELIGKKDVLLKDLSGGQLQRVMLARALVSKPLILLLDEPTSGIDAGMKQSLYELLHSLKKEMTIVFVTHDMSVVSPEIDEIICLNKKLVSHGSPQEALTDHALTCMYGDRVSLFSHCHAEHVHVKGHSE